MPDMTDIELTTILDAMQNDAVINQDSFSSENEELLRRYNADPYGTEVPGRSSVVSNDVQDLVESDMPSLVRTFLGSDEIFKFNPTSTSERDIQEAEDKTKYVDWLIRKQPGSFATNHGFLKDICLQKMGVLKYFFEETEKTEEHEYKNLSIEELQEINDSLLSGSGERSLEIVQRGEHNELGEFDVTFRVTVKRQEIKIIGVPTESFLISQGASSIDDANLVGDTVTKTRGELIAEGHDKKLVRELPQVSTNGLSNNMKQIRFEDEGGCTDDEYKTWANENVEISDLYVSIDYDGDGIAERRHVQKSGDVVLVNEAFDHVPYAMASGILMAHKAIGKSRGEVVTKTAEIKTALTRQMVDNGYMVGNPKMGVNKNVNLDDYLNDSIGGVIRTKGDTNPGQNMMPIEVPFIADKTLLIIQHMDQNKAASVGNQLASQGLNADQLNKETATRFNGVQDASMAKIELVARVIAEVGFRKLYEGVAWMATKFQDTEREFMVLGKPMTSSPKNWRYDHHVDSEVGLGAGDSTTVVENMTGIWNIQQVLKGQGSPLVDSEKEYNTLTKLTKGLDIKDVSEHFNDPSQPDELLKAENEILNKTVEQLKQHVESLQNPLAEAAEIEARGKLITAEGKRELDVATMLQDAKEFQQSLAADMKKHNDDVATKLTELELKYSADVPGSKV